MVQRYKEVMEVFYVYNLVPNFSGRTKIHFYLQRRTCYVTAMKTDVFRTNMLEQNNQTKDRLTQ